MYNQINGISDTFIQRLHKAEFKEFVKAVAVPTFSAQPSNLEPLMFYKKGVPIIPIYTNTNIYKDLVVNRGRLGTDFNPEGANGTTFFTSITKNILTLDGEYTIKEAMPIVNTLIKKAGNNFYGVVLRGVENNTFILNPLHPLVASAILTTATYSVTKFKVLVYFYPNRKAMDKMYKSYNTTVAEVATAVTNLLRLSKRNTEVVLDTSKIMDVVPNKSNTSVTVVKTVLSVDIPESYYSYYNPDAVHYTLPHQLLTRGNIAPYYGTSVLRLAPGSDGECCQIAPFLAANVSNSTIQADDNRIIFNNVCTGSQPKKTLEGLSTLNHSYLGSPLNRTLIRPGALLYADQCIDTSMFLYSKAGYIADYTPIVKEPTPQVVFPAEHIAIFKDNSPATAVIQLKKLQACTTLQAANYHSEIHAYLELQPNTQRGVILEYTDEDGQYIIELEVPAVISERRHEQLFKDNMATTNVITINAYAGHFRVSACGIFSALKDTFFTTYRRAQVARAELIAKQTTIFLRPLQDVIKEYDETNNTDNNTTPPAED